MYSTNCHVLKQRRKKSLDDKQIGISAFQPLISCIHFHILPQTKYAFEIVTLLWQAPHVIDVVDSKDGDDSLAINQLCVQYARATMNKAKNEKLDYG